jgi:hypothetical protein
VDASVRTAQSLTSISVADAGNSLKYSSYKHDIGKICRGLERWTKNSYHAPFRNIGEVLPIGTQQDGISCGVCMLNALEHTILNTRLFTHDARNVLRVRYFTRIMDLLLDRVSKQFNVIWMI